MISQNEFEKRLEEIDQDLCKYNIPIYARPLQATIIYLRKYNISTVLFDSGLFNTVEGNDDIHISTSINKWFDKRYGEKLKIDFSKGKIAVLLKGDIYELKIPLIFGRYVYSEKDKYTIPHEAPKSNTMTINPIDFIGDLTNEL
jgi:hypothetical protein